MDEISINVWRLLQVSFCTWTQSSPRRGITHYVHDRILDIFEQKLKTRKYVHNLKNRGHSSERESDTQNLETRDKTRVVNIWYKKCFWDLEKVQVGIPSESTTMALSDSNECIIVREICEKRSFLSNCTPNFERIPIVNYKWYEIFYLLDNSLFWL